MSNPRTEPSKKGAPVPAHADNVTGSRGEQIAFYAFMGVMVVALILVVVYALAA